MLSPMSYLKCSQALTLLLLLFGNLWQIKRSNLLQAQKLSILRKINQA